MPIPLLFKYRTIRNRRNKDLCTVKILCHIPYPHTPEQWAEDIQRHLKGNMSRCDVIKKRALKFMLEDNRFAQKLSADELADIRKYLELQEIYAIVTIYNVKADILRGFTGKTAGNIRAGTK